jgi:hypothetical protein
MPKHTGAHSNENQFRLALAVFVAGECFAATPFAQGQHKPAADDGNAVHLEGTSEIAASSEEGYPSVLRITLKNSGTIAVDLPMPGIGCSAGDGAVYPQLSWQPDEGMSGTGGGCVRGMSDRPPLMTRVREQWIRLFHSEFIVMSVNIRDSFAIESRSPPTTTCIRGTLVDPQPQFLT